MSHLSCLTPDLMPWVGGAACPQLCSEEVWTVLSVELIWLWQQWSGAGPCFGSSWWLFIFQQYLQSLQCRGVGP